MANRLRERFPVIKTREQIKILKVLPNEGVKIADEGNLLIMDIVVQMEDGSLADIECQKNGYAFPGQRAACYSADLLMRQYRRVKREKEENGAAFSYRDIKNVYTVIFYEKSPGVFTESHGVYIHHSSQILDSGLKINLLQEYVFINLDIYFKIHQNKNVENETDAWLMFLGTDRPEQILNLLETYPWFSDLYLDVYEVCRNTEKVMEMFSEELKILDWNTVQYMIDEMEAEIREKDSQLKEKNSQLEEKNSQLEAKNNQLKEKDSQLERICYSLVRECRENGGDPAEAEKILCERAGMDVETAARIVTRFWKQL